MKRKDWLASYGGPVVILLVLIGSVLMFIWDERIVPEEHVRRYIALAFVCVWFASLSIAMAAWIKGFGKWALFVSLVFPTLFVLARVFIMLIQDLLSP